MNRADIAVCVVAAVVTLVAVAVLVACASAASRKPPVHTHPRGQDRHHAVQGPSGGASDGRSLALVYAPWCKHCKDLLPVFAKLQTAGFRTQVIDGTARGSSWLASNSVTRYPTICVVQDDAVVQHYPAANPRTEKALVQFYEELRLPRA